MSKHKSYHLGVKGLIRNSEGKILLLYKSKGRSEKFGRRPAWDLPGGRIEEGLSIKETLKRELKEETGIKNFENKGLFYAVVSNYEFVDIRRGLILFIYEIKPIGNFRVKLNDEHVKFDWFDKKRAAKLLRIKYPSDFVEKIKGLR